MIIPLLAIPDNIRLLKNSTFKLFSHHNNVINFKNNTQLLGIANNFSPLSPFNLIVAKNDFEIIKKFLPSKIQILNSEIVSQKFKLLPTPFTNVWSPYLNFEYSNNKNLIHSAFYYFLNISNNKGLSIVFKIKNNEKILSQTKQYNIAKTVWLNFSCFINKLLSGENPSGCLKNIIGLGEGLTPAGDDFLTGVICASHFFNFSPIKNVFYSIIKIAKKQTNLLSFNYLKLALNKIFSYEIIDFLQSLNLTDINIYDKIEKINKLGDTSGIDFLSGFFLTFILMEELQNENS